MKVTATHAEILTAFSTGQCERPFPAKFDSVCPMTGVQIRVMCGDKIRPILVNGGRIYVSDKALHEMSFPWSCTEDTHRPFDAKIAREWLEDPRNREIVVMDKLCRVKVWEFDPTSQKPKQPGYSHSPRSWAQFERDTRSCVYMKRVIR